MKAKAAFVIGAGIGYLFGTAAGRQRFEKIKNQANELWQSEPVQHTVQDLQTKASELAKNQGSALVDKVTGKVTEAVGADEPPAPAETTVPSTPPAP